MNIDDLLSKARDAITVKRVFGDPYEKDGVTVIPAAFVTGAGGGGGGKDDEGQEGSGGGFQITGYPVGAFAIKDGDVRWVPVIDPTGLLAIAGFIVIVVLGLRTKLVKAQLRAAARAAKRAKRR